MVTECDEVNFVYDAIAAGRARVAKTFADTFFFLRSSRQKKSYGAGENPSALARVLTTSAAAPFGRDTLRAARGATRRLRHAATEWRPCTHLDAAGLSGTAH